MRFKTVTPHLKTLDLRQTIQFYTDVLGFRLSASWPQDEPTDCILDHGGAHISFTTDPNGWYPPPALAGQLWFDLEDVMAFHAQVAPKVSPEWGPEVYSYGRREFAIRDCNGYLLTFGEATDDPPTCGGD
jgi:catechol 2,3-dioxygenase-like lactoylglutathione lyase family enzyme